jgi:hypothetical protein
MATPSMRGFFPSELKIVTSGLIFQPCGERMQIQIRESCRINLAGLASRTSA